MLQVQSTMRAGFADPVFEAQGAFRAILAALSEPGIARDLPVALTPPAGLAPATAIALLTLTDFETPVYLPEALRTGEAGQWLRFHAGAPIVAAPEAAHFAVLDGAGAAPLLSAFNPGHDQYPDRSTTLFVQCESLAGGPGVTLAGPGIPGERSIAPKGLRPGFWREAEANAALYPLGVDCLFCAGGSVLGLPRSTRITLTEAC